MNTIIYANVFLVLRPQANTVVSTFLLYLLDCILKPELDRIWRR